MFYNFTIKWYELSISNILSYSISIYIQSVSTHADESKEWKENCKTSIKTKSIELHWTKPLKPYEHNCTAKLVYSPLTRIVNFKVKLNIEIKIKIKTWLLIGFLVGFITYFCKKNTLSKGIPIYVIDDYGLVD